MMKKLMMLILSGVSAIVLSGCGGGGSSEPITDFGYFIIQDSGSSDLYSVEGLEYDCGLGTHYTDYDGTFEYVVGSQCVFTFVDVNDVVYAEIIVNDIDFEVDPMNGDYIIYDDVLYDDIYFDGSEILNFYM